MSRGAGCRYRFRAGLRDALGSQEIRNRVAVARRWSLECPGCRRPNGAPMTTPWDRAAHLDLVARLKSSYPELPDAPTPDLIDHERFAAYVKTPHDVGGEPDAPIEFENKQYEIWELNTYVMCEVLGWRGIWLSEERRRIGNVDLGRTIYLGLPYYGRWLLAVARILVEKHHIGLSELAERMAEVKARYEGGW